MNNKYVINNISSTLEENPTYVGTSYGWICPKCGTVYAPHVSTCWKCSSVSETITWAYYNDGNSSTTAGKQPNT